MSKYTHFPNRITSGGVPIIGGGNSIPVKINGKYLIVDSNGGGDYLTLDGAVNVASSGDVIMLAEGHSESIASATSLVIDVAGIEIIGLGVGNKRPKFTFDATASRIPISADDVKISNLVFMCSIASIVSGVTVTGANVEIENCEWNLDATGLEFLQMLDLDTADNAHIVGCKFVAENIAGCNNAIRIDVSPGAMIEHCTFRGDYTTAVITGVAGSAAASVDIQVSNNLIENKDTTAGVCIDMTDTSTGIINDNRMFTLYATDVSAPFDPGNCLCIENYVVNAVDETGVISPTTPSA